MNRKNSVKTTTKTTAKKPRKTSRSRSPKKKMTPKKSSSPKKTPKKKQNSAKATPHKSPRSRTLPKSPISDSMRQRTIQEFFRPSQTPSIITQSSITRPEPKVTRATRSRSKELSTAATELSTLAPVFGQSVKTRYGLRTTRNTSKKLMFDRNDGSNEANNSTTIAKPLIDLTEESVSKTESDLKPMVSSVPTTQPTASTKTIAATDCPQTATLSAKRRPELSQMIDSLTIESEKQKNSNEMDSQTRDQNDAEDDGGLTPVFKRPQPPKRPKKSSAKESSFVDKKKMQKLDYLLKNLARAERDKEIMALQTVAEIDDEFRISTVTHKCVAVIDSMAEEFNAFDYIQQIASQCLPKETDCKSSANSLDQSIIEILKSGAIEMLISEEDSDEMQPLVLHMIDSVAVTDPLVHHMVRNKLFEYIVELNTNFEIYLTPLLLHFYQVLADISSKLNCIPNRNENESQLIVTLLALLEVMARVLEKCDFAIEAIGKDDQLSQLLIVGFALGLDCRLANKTSVVKDFIAMVFKHIFMDETKIRELITDLISLCDSKQSCNALLTLKIASLFPEELDLEFKRQFAICVVNQFVSDAVQPIDLNLNDLIDILERIQWKSLSTQQIHLIIQMIAISLDMTEDYYNYQETISTILRTLDLKISTSVQTDNENEIEGEESAEEMVSALTTRTLGQQIKSVLQFLITKVKLFFSRTVRSQ